MKQMLIENILFIERLHRRFLDVIKAELDRLRVDDVNNVQTLILYNISSERMTISELTNRGYYLGSNVSYNIKKLVENGYLVQEKSPHDKRAVRIRLSEKGLELCAKIDGFLERSVVIMKDMGVKDNELGDTSKVLRKVERFLADLLSNVV